MKNSYQIIFGSSQLHLKDNIAIGSNRLSIDSIYRCLSNCILNMTQRLTIRNYICKKQSFLHNMIWYECKQMNDAKLNEVSNLLGRSEYMVLL